MFNVTITFINSHDDKEHEVSFWCECPITERHVRDAFHQIQVISVPAIDTEVSVWTLLNNRNPGAKPIFSFVN